MIYFTSAIIGLGAALLGCLVAPIAMLIWASRKTETETISVGFSPMAIVHSVGFGVFIIVLFTAGFAPSVFLLRRY